MMQPYGEQVEKHFAVDEAQWAATDPDRNLAVTAGAGSGKTRVLTTRYIRLLLDNSDLGPEQIAAVTFTEKAALEMKDRIRAMIEKEIRRADDRAAMLRWQRIRDRIGTAPIGTIHSFCSRLLRENFFRIGLAPDFQVLNEAEQNTKMAEMAEEAVNHFANDPHNRAAAEPLVQMVGADGLIDGTLTDLLLRIYRKIREQGLDVTEASSLTQKKYQDMPGGTFPIAEKALLEMIRILDSLYEKWKNRQSRLDFSDLEVLASRLLADQEIAQKTRSRYRFIMMDEFQDTNPLQKEILYRLVAPGQKLEENRLFIVGDHKQSIYGFRGTDFRIFSQVCTDMGEDAVRSLSVCFRSTETLIRAVNAVFEGMIHPYDPLLAADSRVGQGGDPVELIVCPYEKGGDPRTEAVTVLNKVLQEEESAEDLKQMMRQLDEMETETDREDLEAQVLARRVQQFHDRGVAYQDMAVLIRTRFPLPRIENALRKAKIPYCVLGGTGFAERQEIRDMMNLYKTVYDPQDKIALAAALRSPLFGLSDADLQRLSSLLFAEKTQGQETLPVCVPGVDDDTRAQVTAALQLLAAFRKEAPYESAAEMITRLQDEVSLPAVLLNQENGAQKARNMEKLLEIAREFDQTRIFHPRQFPRYLEELSAGQGGGSEAALDTEDSEAVKIMTIHGAKGLEFDTVLVPDTGRKLVSGARKKAPALFHPQLGLCIRNEDEEEAQTSQFYLQAQNEQNEKDLEEALRVMYVAATRAKERLVYIGTEKKSSNSRDSFLEILTGAAEEDDDPSRWIVQKSAEQVLAEDIQQEESTVLEKSEISAAAAEKMIERVHWQWQGPMRIYSSISQYLLYRNCPRRYFLSVQLGLEDIADDPFDPQDSKDTEMRIRLPAALRGTIVHQAIADLEQFPQTDPNEHLQQNLRRFCPEIGDSEREQMAASLIFYLEHYRTLQSELEALYSGESIHQETEFSFRIPLDAEGTMSLQGVVDRLYLFTDQEKISGHVIDFKTNRIRSHEDIPRMKDTYYPQLLIYRRAVQQLYRYKGKKLDDCRTSLFLLDVGVRVDIEADPQREEQMLADMRDAFSYMAGHHKSSDYPPGLESQCSYCGYRLFCQGKTLSQEV